jgi:hypothetical protein
MTNGLLAIGPIKENTFRSQLIEVRRVNVSCTIAVQLIP